MFTRITTLCFALIALQGVNSHMAVAQIDGLKTSPDGLETVDVSKSLGKSLKKGVIEKLQSLGQNLSMENPPPFLARVEAEIGRHDHHNYGSITSVDTLLTSTDNQHHLIGQISWMGTDTERDQLGLKRFYNTVSGGLAYRHLALDKSFLIGANSFVDHSSQMNHNRLSIGLEARNRFLALGLNRYLPLSADRLGPTSVLEKTTSGWDMNMRGQMTSLPSWTAVLSGYQWDQQNKGLDLYGTSAGVEFSPVPAVTMGVALQDDNQSDLSLEAMLRLTLHLGDEKTTQWQRRTDLPTMDERVADTIKRDRLIRVER